MSSLFTLNSAIKDAARSGRMNAGIKAMRTRPGDFPSALCMNLSGIAAVPDARKMVSDRLCDYWSRYNSLNRYTDPSDETSEVVIGGGLHAAIYCAGRAAMGFPKPIVLEANATPGGAFAFSETPSFRLNSNNRPGLIGGPGMDQALNYLPGAPIQPAQLSLSEYQTNCDMSWIIRVTLACFADVRTGAKVDRVNPYSDYYILEMSNGATVTAGRVIDARGLGQPNGRNDADGKTVQTFPQFLASMDTTFPLKSMGRVAVIGGGDSGKVTVEALLGIGPSAGMSTAALDYVPSVDWYGRSIPQYCAEWSDTERRRYGRIGAYLPRRDDPRKTRLSVIRERGETTRSIGSVLVNDRVYDRAIIATGFKLSTLTDESLRYDFDDVGTQPVIARRAGGNRRALYAIGPAADIPFSDSEYNAGAVTRFPANRVSMFRTAPRTAALAAKLGIPSYGE
jgi:hypothetical protein